MSTAVLEKPPVSVPTVLPHSEEMYAPEDSPDSARIPITRTMARMLADNGLIVGKYEIIDGELISKMGQNPPHAYTLSLLFKWLLSLFGVDFLRPQLPIDPNIPDAEIQEPQPDIAVLNVSWTTMPDRHPTSAEILLAVEVAHSSLESDRTRKAKLYARAEIPEYWIADIKSRSMIVHRAPQNGEYQDIKIYAAHEALSCLTHPEASKLVDELIVPHSTENKTNSTPNA